MALKKLGNGPFTVVEVMEPDYAVTGDAAWPESFTPADRCDCCGSKISWRAIVTAPERDAWFTMGLTCASKAGQGIDSRAVTDLKHKAVRRERDRYLADESFVAWLKTQKHPKGWKGTTRYDDVRYWVMRKLPKMTIVRKAWREWKGGAAVDLLPEGVEQTPEWHALAALRDEHKDALAALPHPVQKRWAKKLTMLDYANYWLDKGDIKVRTIRDIKAALGLIDMERVKALNEEYQAAHLAFLEAEKQLDAAKSLLSDAIHDGEHDDALIIQRGVWKLEEKVADLKAKMATAWDACTAALEG